MTTIVCIGDARPTSSEHGSNGWTQLTPDLNQIKTQSPTNSCDGIFLIGDFDKVKDTQRSFAASTVNSIPHYYVIGNHEIDDDDPNYVKNLYPYASYNIPLNSGPTGTNKTTYSMDIGDIHIINVNVYWNGTTGEFSSNGYIPDALYNWISTDLSNTTKKWKVVLLHEPLYPCKRHVGDSLDASKSNRDKFQALLVSKGVHIVYAAHTHYAHVTRVKTSTGNECSSVATSGVYHIDCGVSGPKIKDGEDSFCSLFYTETRGNDLVITWKKGPWSNATKKEYIITGSATSPKPIVTSISPSGQTANVPTTVTITGSNFSTDASIEFTGAQSGSQSNNLTITQTSISWLSHGIAPIGTYYFKVRNGDNQLSDNSVQFTISEAIPSKPILTSMVPPNYVAPGPYTTTLVGSNFDAGANGETYDLNGVMTGTSANHPETIRTSTGITWTGNLDLSSVGTYKMKVKNGNGQYADNVITFNVTVAAAPKPVLTSMTPLNTTVGDLVHRVVTGSNFNETSDVIFDSSGLYELGHSNTHNPTITPTSITWDSTQGNYPGTFDVYVINGDGQKSNTHLTSIVSEETTSELASITLSGCASQPKKVGDTCRMTPVCKNSSGATITCPNLTWISSDPSIVSVVDDNEKGFATALSVGSCNVKAKSGNITSNTVPFSVIENQETGSGNAILALAGATVIGYYLYTRKNKTQ